MAARLLYLALAGLPLAGLYACSDSVTEQVEKSVHALDGQNGISANLNVSSTWETGSCHDVVVRNNHTTSATSTWKVTLDLRGATISSGWNGSFSASSGQVDVTNLSWNGTIAPGGTTSFGVCINRSAAEAPIVVSVTSDLPGGTGGTGGMGGSGGTGGSTGGSGGSTGGSGGSSAGSGGTGGSATHTRNLSAYGADTVFLVSDADYRAVMSLVPVTTFRASEDADYAACQHPHGGAEKSCAYPTLIYHEENGVADIDPIFHFLEQSGATKIVHASTLPAAAHTALAASFTLAPLAPRKDYWTSTPKVVRVADNYAQALVAASYAALLDVPLVIEGYDALANYGAATTICVGTLPGTCTETISVATAQKRIQTLTNSKRLVLTSSVDLAAYSTQSPIALERTPGSFAQLYGKASLAAPFLAVAKAQIPLVFTTANPTPSAVDTFIGQQLTALGVADPEYLTIVAAPHTIPQARFNVPVMRNGTVFPIWSQVDNALYGDLDGDLYLELKVGRIFSQSVSGVSANIARSLFHHRMAKSNAFATLASFTQYFSLGHSTFIDRALANLGYTKQSATSDYATPFPVDSFRNKMLLFYEGHGHPRGGSGGFTTDTLRAERVWFPSTIGSSLGCSTCSFDKGEHEGLFCAELIRRGAIAFYGTVDDTSDNNRGPTHFIQRLIKGDDLGTAFRNGMNRGFADSVLAFSPYDVLIGDPTFNPGFAGTGVEDTIHVTSGSLTNTGSGYVVPFDIVLEPVNTVQKLHNRFSFDRNHDIVETPFYAGDNSFRNMIAHVRQYPEPPATGSDESFIGEDVTVVASFANPERRIPRSYRYVERRIGNGAPQDLTAEYNAFPPHAVTNSAGTTFVQLSARPENGLIGPNTTSFPEVRFRFELVFE